MASYFASGLYSLVHTDDLASQIARFSVVVLPEMAVLSDAVCATLREFVAGGGGLVASGAVAKRDETGEWRGAFPLADVLGVEATNEEQGILSGADTGWDAAQRHSYLQVVQSAHRLFEGLEDTDLLPFGGVLNGARATSAQVVATYLPSFPIFPPETAWFEAPRNPLPALFASEFGSGRTVYLAADIERCFERDGLPDHARLLENAVRFVAKTPIPLEVSGAGLLDCRLFRQESRLILHLVNQQNGAPAPLHELVAVGPFGIKVRRDLLPASALSARFLVGGTNEDVRGSGDWWEFSVATIHDHEVIVLDE